MYKLKVLSNFSAAHQLLQNMVNKKCENLHGHNWKVEVCVTGEQLDKSGVIIDFSLIKKYLRNIVEGLDHQFLNSLKCFSDNSPSSENIAAYIAKHMQEKINKEGLLVSEVAIWESDDACATYYPKYKY